MNNWKLKDSAKWRRKSSGHYELYAWYIWKELEIHAEIFKEKNKWCYRLWTWGSVDPQPLEASYQKFDTAKEIKAHVMELVENGEPHTRKRPLPYKDLW